MQENYVYEKIYQTRLSIAYIQLRSKNTSCKLVNGFKLKNIFGKVFNGF